MVSGPASAARRASQPGDQPAGSVRTGAAGSARSAAQVGADTAAVGVQAAVGAAQVAGLGHGEVTIATSGRGEVAQEARVVGRGMHRATLPMTSNASPSALG